MAMTTDESHSELDGFEQYMKDFGVKPEPEEETVTATFVHKNQQDVDLVKLHLQLQTTEQPIRFLNRKLKLKLKLLNKYPNSYFMDVRCNGCFFVSTIFSHPRGKRTCPMCYLTLCLPSETRGDPGTLYKGTFWRKTDKFFSDFVYGPLPPA